MNPVELEPGQEGINREVRQEITLNGLIGNAKSYANITAVGALIVFMVITMGIMSYVSVVFIDSHRELTKAFRDVAVELRVLGEKNSRDAFEFRLEMRQQNEETHKLIRLLTTAKKD